MFKGIFLMIILGALVSPSFGFVFHDPGTCAELVAFKASQYGQMAQELGYSAEQIAKLQQQIQKFQEYKAQFDRYYGTFATCYRAINSGNWQGLATTINQVYLQELARRQEEIDEAKAVQVRQDAQEAGLLSADRLAQEDIDRAAEVLKNTAYYQRNPVLKAQIDTYLAKRQNNFDYDSQLLNKLTATIKMIQARNATIARLEEQNRQLSTGDDQQSLVAQMALNNQIMLEQMKQQNEIEELHALLLSRQVEKDDILQQSIITEGDYQDQRTGVMDQLLAPLQDSAPAPKRKR